MLMSKYVSGQKVLKHVLRPEETDNEDCAVKALEWDPLSTDYVLAATMHSGISLIDCNTATVIINFQPPSACCQVYTLSWIHTAPGMFVTGGKILN